MLRFLGGAQRGGGGRWGSGEISHVLWTRPGKENSTGAGSEEPAHGGGGGEVGRFQWCSGVWWFRFGRLGGSLARASVLLWCSRAVSSFPGFASSRLRFLASPAVATSGWGWGGVGWGRVG